MLASGTIMAWLRLKSGSLWTGALAHAANNLWVQSFFDPVTVNHGITNPLIGEFGLVTTVMAVILWKLRRRLPRDGEGPEPAVAGTATPAGA